jgi:RNA polymerase sigma factor (sigma-70 family)
MMTAKAMETAVFTDAELVAESLDGNAEAFRRIVERYQTLISSLAYCATGNVGRSEELAQETFVNAWKQLADLREPARLRPWLCSILRFRISKERRRLGREPAHAAESLEEVDAWVSPEPLPPDRVISEEEKAILWRSLEHIPEIYREPLVLFYREQLSIKAVAEDLELSEDAVRQRLSRGRKLLQKQFLAFIAGALKQTAPGETFTLSVMDALSLLATTAKAAAVATTATKGGSVAKAATGAGMLSAFLSAGMMTLYFLFGIFGYFGRWVGRKMGRARQQTALGRKRIIQFWRTLAIGFFVLVLLPILVLNNPTPYSHPGLFQVQTWSLVAFYWLVAAALAIWVWQRRQDACRGDEEATETTRTITKRYNLWIALGMIGPAFLVGTALLGIFFSGVALTCKQIPEAKARSIISERKDAQFKIYHYRDGSQELRIILPENQRTDLSAPLNSSLLSALTKKGIAYQTKIEDRDFNNGGVMGWVVFLSFFIVATGTVLLLRRPGTQMFHQQEIATPRAERREKNIILVCAALAMIAMSVLLVLMNIAHTARNISGTEAGRMILEHKNARFEVLQYYNGSKELWITLPGSRTYPGFIAPADASTLALLAENKIAYKTAVQGRDFGYNIKAGWLMLSCSFILMAGGVMILWRMARKKRTLPSSAESRVSQL